MIQIGRLIRSNLSLFVVGCDISQLGDTAFGALVKVPLGERLQVYGVVADIRVQDDDLVRQIAKAARLSQSLIADHRMNRLYPVEISAQTVGFCDAEGIHHHLPPRPPLSLEAIHLCGPAELVAFTAADNLSYLKLLLGFRDLPLEELLLAHLEIAHAAHAQAGEPGWRQRALQRLGRLIQNEPELYARLITSSKS